MGAVQCVTVHARRRRSPVLAAALVLTAALAPACDSATAPAADPPVGEYELWGVLFQGFLGSDPVYTPFAELDTTRLDFAVRGGELIVRADSTFVRRITYKESAWADGTDLASFDGVQERSGVWFFGDDYLLNPPPDHIYFRVSAVVPQWQYGGDWAGEYDFSARFSLFQDGQRLVVGTPEERDAGWAWVWSLR